MNVAIVEERYHASELVIRDDSSVGFGSERIVPGVDVDAN